MILKLSSTCRRGGVRTRGCPLDPQRRRAAPCVHPVPARGDRRHPSPRDQGTEACGVDGESWDRPVGWPGAPRVARTVSSHRAASSAPWGPGAVHAACSGPGGSPGTAHVHLSSGLSPGSCKAPRHWGGFLGTLCQVSKGSGPEVWSRGPQRTQPVLTSRCPGEGLSRG